MFLFVLISRPCLDDKNNRLKDGPSGIFGIQKSQFESHPS